jgi:DNA-binding CsgD family transcriptional regulator
MSSRLENIRQRYVNLINSIPFAGEDLDYAVLDRIGKSAVSVFDMYRKTHVYISPSYRSRLGLPDDTREGPEGFDLLMHPDDRLTASEAGYYFLKMALAMENGRLRDYKLVNDYRILKPDHSWMRMTEQHSILETDIHGNIWLTLSIADVSPDKNIDSPMKSRLVHRETGELLEFRNESGFPFPGLSSRELEILKLISMGRISKQIAEELHISVHTVNTHRQNIIEKMGATNTAEAVRLATGFGML